jgi:hypothetical protein
MEIWIYFGSYKTSITTKNTDFWIDINQLDWDNFMKQYQEIQMLFLY